MERNLCEEVFGNHLILKNIIAHCDFDTLKSFRRVCYAWYDASLKTFRKQSLVSLLECGHVEVVNEWPEFEIILNEKEMNFAKLHQYPYENIEIPPRISWVPFQREKKKYQCVWQLLGSRVSSIEINTCDLSEQDFDRFLFSFLPNISHIKLMSFNPDGDTGNTFVLLPSLKSISLNGNLPYGIDVLQKFPNLEILELSDVWYENLFESLTYLRESSGFSILNLSKLTIIRSHLFVPPQSIIGLSKCKFPLKSLNLDIYGTLAEHSEIQRVVEHRASFLESLQFTFNWEKIYGFRFPFNMVLPILTNLQFCGGMIIYYDFLTNTPTLKRLTLSLPQYNYKFFETFPSITCINLERLDIQNVVHPMGWKMFGVSFPNLKVLVSSIDDECFAVICDQWRKLCVLKAIRFSRISDETLLLNPNNITLLKDLEELVLRGYNKRSNIADLEDGLLKMTKLTRLTFCGGHGVSSHCEKNLKRAVQHVDICRKAFCVHTDE